MWNLELDYNHSRPDLEPRLVYRGTRDEVGREKNHLHQKSFFTSLLQINPDDIGLVKSAQDKQIMDDGYRGIVPYFIDGQFLNQIFLGFCC